MFDKEAKIQPGIVTKITSPKYGAFIKKLSFSTLLLWAALLLRLFLLPITAHQDLLVLSWSARPLALGHWDVYDSGLRQFVEYGWPKAETPVSHGPLFYYMMGAWLWLMGLLRLFPVQAWQVYTPATNFSPLDMTVLKLPALFFDLLAAYSLSRIFSGNQRQIALGLWLFAAPIFYLTFFSGQDDIFMTSLICLSLYFAAKAFKQIDSSQLPKEAYWSMLALSGGACFKLFPLFYLPLAALLLARTQVRTRGQSFKISGLLFLVGLAPVAALFGISTILNRTFLSSVLLSGEAKTLTALGFPNGLGFFSWWWVGYIGVIAFLLLTAGSKANFSNFVSALGLITIIFLVVGVYPPQFMIWFMPFLVLMVAQKPKLYPAYFILIAGCLIMILAVDNNLDLNGLLFFRDPATHSMLSAKGFLSSILPWETISSINGAIVAVTLITSWALYSLENTNLSLKFLKLSEKQSSPGYSPATATLQTVHLPNYLLFVPALLFMFLISFLFLIAGMVGGESKVDQPAITQGLALATSTNQVEQAFTAPVGKLEKLQIPFGTNNRFNLSRVQVQLFKLEPVKTEIAKLLIDTFYLKDFQFYTIKLLQPLELLRPTRLSILVTSPDGTSENSVTIVSTPFSQATLQSTQLTVHPNKNAQFLYPAVVNNIKTDQVMSFKTVYQIDWVAKASLYLDYFGRTPVFSLLYFGFWLIMLLGFILTLLLMRIYKKP